MPTELHVYRCSQGGETGGLEGPSAVVTRDEPATACVHAPQQHSYQVPEGWEAGRLLAPLTLLLECSNALQQTARLVTPGGSTWRPQSRPSAASCTALDTNLPQDKMCEMGTAADDQVLLLFFSRSHGYFFQGFCERERALDQSDPDERHHDAGARSRCPRVQPQSGLNLLRCQSSR